MVPGTDTEMETEAKTEIVPAQPSTPTINPNSNQVPISQAWMAWLGFCAGAIALVVIAFYRLLLVMRKTLVNIQKLFTVYPSFFHSFL